MTYLCIQFVSLKFTPKLTFFFSFFSVLVKIPINLLLFFFPRHYKVVLVVTTWPQQRSLPEQFAGDQRDYI